MESSNLPSAPVCAARDTREAAAGELVVLNGRQSGTRKALGVPTTFIGRAPSCDVRLNVEGVEPYHCVLTYHAGAASVRDLNSAQGTFVNGQRITTTALRDGDLLDVGPFRFRVLLPAPRPTAAAVARPAPDHEALREAVRIQAAAIAAQQAALDEREATLEAQQQAEAAELRRARAQLDVEAQRHGERSAALDRVRSELQHQESDLAVQRVRLNTERELESRLLLDGWRCLEDDRERWRRRRNRECMALRARRLVVLEGDRALARMRAAIRKESAAWDAQRHALHAELLGLNSRIAHQRQQLQPSAALPAASAETPAGRPTDAARARRSADLDRLACELADQRALLIEQWERLARLQHDWEARRDATANEMAALVQRLAQQEETLGRREHEVEAAERQLRARQEQLEQMQRQAALAQARSQAQQQAWHAEREQVLTELAHLSEQARQQLESLGRLRRNWERRRQQEADAARYERHACAQLREELASARHELHDHARLLEDAHRALADKMQAFESDRDPRSVSLRRRWLAQSAAVVRALRREGERFARELTALGALQQALAAQAERQAQTQAEVLEQQTALEHREATLAAGEARLEQAMRAGEQRRWSTERRLMQLEEEKELLARALITDSEPPPPVLERAA